jgi:hypothetical protein
MASSSWHCISRRISFSNTSNTGDIANPGYYYAVPEPRIVHFAQRNGYEIQKR